jgi:hypothetical protein
VGKKSRRAGRAAKSGRAKVRDVFVARPFDGLAAEPELIAMREFVPSATAPLTLASEAAREVTLAAVLPGAAAAMVRDDGAAFVGLQVQTRSSDVSRDLGRCLRWALDAGLGEVLAAPDTTLSTSSPTDMGTSTRAILACSAQHPMTTPPMASNALAVDPQELRRRMHWPIAAQGKWLRQVVQGYFNYHAVPTNSPALSAFRFSVTELWRRTLRRRSQKDGMTWEQIARLANDWLPKPITLHPWPLTRFAVTHPRWEPYAGKPHVRICAGGAQQ